MHTKIRKAIFIAGFENWGKTSVICQLFDRQNFLFGWHYAIDDIDARFTVDSHSNDDLGGERWLELITRRIKQETEADLHLISAICPTVHVSNDFCKLLSQSPFGVYQELHILLLEFKFDHHARLMVDNIIQTGGAIPNVHFHVINADAPFTDIVEKSNARLVQILNVIGEIFS